MIRSNSIAFTGLGIMTAALLSACSSQPGLEETSSDHEAVASSALPTTVIRDRVVSYLQRLPVASASAAPVMLANGLALDVEHAAETSFPRQRELTEEVAAATGALLAPPDVSEEFIETENTVMLVATTHMVVTDPAALRIASPKLDKFRMKGPGSLTLAGMDAGQRAAFDRFRSEMLKKPISHPLRAAARQSSAALLDAVLSGKGDLTVTTVVEMPTDTLASDGSTYMAPAVGDGMLDYTALHSLAIPGFASNAPTFEDEVLPGGQVTTTGTSTVVTEFVNGFTSADAFTWSEDWNFGVGSVTVEAGASYGAGFRIPIKVTGTTTPTTISRIGGAADADSSFSSTISVDVIDADADFYEDAGLEPIDVQSGQEFVLNAEAHVTIDVDILGTDVKVTLPKGLAVDKGQDFKPPFGECGTECGLDLWLPAELTKTQVSIGIAGADAQIGVNVSGEGTVNLDYQSLYDHDVVSSTRAGSTKKTHSLSFTQEGDRNFTTTLEALDEHGDKNFGYKVSNLNYTWDVAISPGVKADVWVDCLVLDWSEELGPFFFDDWRIDLGSMEFGPHAGSRTSRSVNKGTKSWQGLTTGNLGSTPNR